MDLAHLFLIFRVASPGDTLEEADQNIREAIAGHLQMKREHGDSIPTPTTLAEYVEIPMAVGQ